MDKVKHAKRYLRNIVRSTYVDLDVNKIWDYMLDEPDFVVEIRQSAKISNIEVAVEVWLEYVLDNFGAAEFSTRETI